MKIDLSKKSSEDEILSNTSLKLEKNYDNLNSQVMIYQSRV